MNDRFYKITCFERIKNGIKNDTIQKSICFIVSNMTFKTIKFGITFYDNSVRNDKFRQAENVFEIYRFCDKKYKN